MDYAAVVTFFFFTNNGHDRFGDVPQATQTAVAKITDLAEFRRLTLLAAKCKSPAEFAKALK